MIVDGPLHARGMLLAVWKPLLALTLLDLAVTAGYGAFGLDRVIPGDVPMPLLGTGLVVFLGMRNSTAYARWWEARTLWGAVVNQSRNFARTVSTVLPGADAGLRRTLILHQVGWARALRHSLRREDPLVELAGALPPASIERLRAASNVPFAIQREIGDLVGEAARGGRIDSMQMHAVNGILNALTDAQGGLERIRNTPMPHHYVVLPRLFVIAYCVLLPFGLVTDLGWFTPLVALVIGLVFLTLDRAGANLEDPFARTVHDLPMTAISRTIEIDLKEAIDHDDPPAPVRAVFGVLR